MFEKSCLAIVRAIIEGELKGQAVHGAHRILCLGCQIITTLSLTLSIGHANNENQADEPNNKEFFYAFPFSSFMENSRF